ncbi:MAG: S-layer homology domain-containing protein [Acidimicrobiales bacterium]
MTDRYFAPQLPITRGDFAVMLWRYAGEPRATSSRSFADVRRGYQVAAVAWMAEKGITTGTTPDTFSPDGLVSRAEAATFLYRYVDPPSVPNVPSEPCGRGLRTALQAHSLTAAEAKCAAPYLVDFDVDYLVAVVHDRAEASLDLITAAVEVANACLAPHRIGDLSRLFL